MKWSILISLSIANKISQDPMILLNKKTGRKPSKKISQDPMILLNKKTVRKSFKTKTGYVKQYHGFLCDKVVQHGYDLLSLSDGNIISEPTSFYDSIESAVRDNGKPTFVKKLHTDYILYFWEYLEVEKPIFLDREANTVHVVLVLKTNSKGKAIQEIITANIGRTGSSYEKKAII